MPEFVIENKRELFETESPFVAGFIEAAFFTNVSPVYDSSDWFEDETQAAISEGTSDGELPSDVGYSDLHPDSLKWIRDYCAKFQNENTALIAKATESGDYDETRAGADYWYTRNGHGVGFWSRDELDSELGKQLTDATGRGEVYPFYQKEDGKAFVYFEGY